MATTARNRQDVENLSTKDRLWDSLSHSYGKKQEEIDKSYDKAYSAADRQLLGRGMQRSSYGAQTLANINKQRADAQGQNYDDLIADFENRLTQAEQQEAENAFREKQFEESVRQFNAAQELTRTENALNRAFQTSERLGSQQYQSGENALNRAFQTSEREAQQRYGTSEREAQQAYNTSERMASQAYQSGENALNRAFQTGEREASQAFQAGENAANRAQDQAQFEANLAYNRERAAAQDNQWQTAFNYQAGRDERSDYQWGEEFRVQQEQFASQQDFQRRQQEQQLAIEYAKALLAAEQPVPNSLLQQAGLSIVGGQVVVNNDNSIGGNAGGYSGGNSGNGRTSSSPAPSSSSKSGNDYSGASANDLFAAADRFITDKNGNKRTVYSSFSLSNK